MQRKLMLRPQITQARIKIMAPVQSDHHSQLVHLVLNLSLQTLQKPGILPTCNKKQEDQNRLTELKHPTMQMVVAHTITTMVCNLQGIINTRVKEWMKETVQANYEEASPRRRHRRGDLLFSKPTPMHGG